MDIKEMKENVSNQLSNISESLDNVFSTSIDLAHQSGYLKALKEIFKIIMETDVEKDKLAFIIQQSIKIIDPEWESPYVERDESETVSLGEIFAETNDGEIIGGEKIHAEAVDGNNSDGMQSEGEVSNTET